MQKLVCADAATAHAITTMGVPLSLVAESGTPAELTRAQLAALVRVSVAACDRPREASSGPPPSICISAWFSSWWGREENVIIDVPAAVRCVYW